MLTDGAKLFCNHQCVSSDNRICWRKTNTNSKYFFIQIMHPPWNEGMYCRKVNPNNCHKEQRMKINKGKRKVSSGGPSRQWNAGIKHSDGPSMSKGWRSNARLARRFLLKVQFLFPLHFNSFFLEAWQANKLPGARGWQCVVLLCQLQIFSMNLTSSGILFGQDWSLLIWFSLKLQQLQMFPWQLIYNPNECCKCEPTKLLIDIKKGSLLVFPEILLMSWKECRISPKLGVIYLLQDFYGTCRSVSLGSPL